MGLKLENPDIDNGVMEYVSQLCDDGCAVSYKMVQNRAQEIACTLHIRPSQFEASTGWVIGCMRRCNLSLRRGTSLSQCLPKDC